MSIGRAHLGRNNGRSRTRKEARLRERSIAIDQALRRSRHRNEDDGSKTDLSKGSLAVTGIGPEASKSLTLVYPEQLARYPHLSAVDLRAADMVLSRVWPIRKGRPLSLSLPLPKIETAADIVTALGVCVRSSGGWRSNTGGRRSTRRHLRDQAQGH